MTQEIATLEQQLHDAAQAVETARQARAQAVKQRNNTIIEATNLGATRRAVATHAHISVPRVQQIIDQHTNLNTK